MKHSIAAGSVVCAMLTATVAGVTMPWGEGIRAQGSSTVCNDDRDNDGDGAIDYPADTGCLSITDADESNTACILTSNSTAFTKYTLPQGASHPQGFAQGPDGNLWFTEPSADKVGRITPQGVITRFNTSPGATPVEITAGPDGNLWYTAANGNAIVKLTPQGVSTSYSVPTPSSLVQGITSGPDGNLWFVERSGNRIGRITPQGVITEFVLNDGFTPVWEPQDIAADPGGNLWFTDGNKSKIGRMTPQGVVTEYPLSGGLIASRVTAGPDGNMWFAGGGLNLRVTPQGTITTFNSGLGGAGLDIASGPGGQLWLIGMGYRVASLSTSGQYAFYPFEYNSRPESRLAMGSDGNLWFTEFGENAIVKFAPCFVPIPEDGPNNEPSGGNDTATPIADPLAGPAPKGNDGPSGGNMCIIGCGDGIRAGGEGCDDGNMQSGDGCKANCEIECGLLKPCASGTCVSGECVLPVCGDGKKQAPEACDDGNDDGGDGCSDECAKECTSAAQCPGGAACVNGLCSACGNDVVEPPEACDSGAFNGVPGDICSAACKLGGTSSSSAASTSSAAPPDDVVGCCSPTGTYVFGSLLEPSCNPAVQECFAGVYNGCIADGGKKVTIATPLIPYITSRKAEEDMKACQKTPPPTPTHFKCDRRITPGDSTTMCSAFNRVTDQLGTLTILNSGKFSPREEVCDPACARLKSMADCCRPDACQTEIPENCVAGKGTPFLFDEMGGKTVCESMRLQGLCG